MNVKYIMITLKAKLKSQAKFYLRRRNSTYIRTWTVNVMSVSTNSSKYQTDEIYKIKAGYEISSN